MKTRSIFLLLALLVFCKPANADWRIDCSRWAQFANYPIDCSQRGSWATESECKKAKAEYARQMGDAHFDSMAECVDCGGSGSSFRGTPVQQMALGLLDKLLNSIFTKPDNSRQIEIERQNAVRRQQAEELERQRQLQLQKEQELARQKMEEQERQRQLQLQKEQELARQKKFDEEKDQLLDAFKDTSTGMLEMKGSSAPTSELKLKTGTDLFQGDAVDLRYLKGKQGIVGSLKTSEEQAEFEKSPVAWKEKQGELIQQRLEEPNKWCSGIQAHLMGNVPPLPAKTFNELQPGDVLLLEGKMIAGIDNKFTSDKAGDSVASHTVIFLKEVNGKKYFLDNQPAPVNWGKGGPRIITDAEFLDTYGHRGAELARLVGQPLNKEEGDRLFHAAVEMAQKNRKTIANNFLGSGYFGTNYGVKGEDMVCSESDWALLNLAREKQIPKSGDQTKVEWGIDWSPADFRNRQYFLVTPLIMHKQAEGK